MHMNECRPALDEKMDSDRKQIWSKLKANNTFTQFWLNLLRGKDHRG